MKDCHERKQGTWQYQGPFGPRTRPACCFFLPWSRRSETKGTTSVAICIYLYLLVRQEPIASKKSSDCKPCKQLCTNHWRTERSLSFLDLLVEDFQWLDAQCRRGSVLDQQKIQTAAWSPHLLRQNALAGHHMRPTVQPCRSNSVILGGQALWGLRATTVQHPLFELVFSSRHPATTV
jgi:hypothetical protein